jgi:hypothetical protein
MLSRDVKLELELGLELSSAILDRMIHAHSSFGIRSCVLCFMGGKKWGCKKK